ncbi:MAG: ribonuclease HII, partial [Microbacteriaceae bacterium]
SPQLVEWLKVSQVGYASPDEIDDLGITRAQSLAAFRALEAIFVEHPVSKELLGIMIDGHFDWLSSGAAGSTISGTRVLFRPKLDRDSALVAAASVVAKVERDALMSELGEQHPEYGWASNKGYGSAQHKIAVLAHGQTKHHRQSWIADWR